LLTFKISVFASAHCKSLRRNSLSFRIVSVTMPPQQRTVSLDISDSSSVVSKSSVVKRFHFSLASNEIYNVPHIDDMTEEEVKAIWYEKADYEKIKMGMIPLIRKMMRKEEIEETDKETVRGLEYRTRQGAIRRQHNKLEAITAVLDEQDRQLDCDGFINGELLSEVYRQFNSHCQEEAHVLALNDVEPAKHFTADAMELVRRQHDLEERHLTGRKASFSKLIKQMRVRRRPSLVVDDTARPMAVVGQAA
jgi:hypothetical protein